MGIEPPSRIRTGRAPQMSSMASSAASTIGPLASTTTGSAPCRCVTSTVTPGGATDWTCSVNSSAIFFGSWSGTRRIETLAPPQEGSTVFAPLPM